MALREFKCSHCKHTTETIMSVSKTPPPTFKCEKCGDEADLVKYSTTNLARASFQEAPIDIKVGSDASKKWQMYNDRQSKRDKIRLESQSLGLSTNDGNQYAPISDDQRNARERANEARKQGIPSDPEMI